MTQPAPGRSLRSLRREVTAAGIVMALVIIVLLAVVLIALRDQAIQNSDRELETVSRITAERTSQTFSAADLLARSVMALANKTMPGDLEALYDRAVTEIFHDRLLRLKNLLPQIEIAAVIDAQGDMLASSQAFPAPPINLSSASFFNQLKEKPERGLVVSKPVQLPSNGQWILYLARPLMDVKGGFQGIVLVGIPASYFEGYFSTIDVGPTTTVTLVNADAQVIARWPDGDDLVGTVLSAYSRHAPPALDHATLHVVQDANQHTRRAAVARLQVQDIPFFLSVSRTEVALLAPWRSALVWLVVFALISLTVIGTLAWFILRAVRDEECWGGALLEREMRLSQQAIELATARDLAEIANRARGDFLANMSHELRTPLNAVLGFSEILETELFGALGDPRYREFARDIHNSGKHLLDVISNILDLAKVDAGRLDLDEEEVDITGMMHACGRFMAETANSAGVELEIRAPSQPVLVMGDATRIRQIFLNLLSNAVKFSPRGQRVVLAGTTAPDGCVLQIIDNGIGMTEAEADMAMQPFRQIDSSLSRRYQGTGLGLPLTKSLVTLHGGFMDIKSVPGQGTTVTVWLPRQRHDTVAMSLPEQLLSGRVLANH